jgi:hypothetical protein
MAGSDMNREHAQKFIFDALHLDTQLPETATAIQMQDADWDYLLIIAREHRLGAMLHHRLKRSDLAGVIPERVLTYLKAAHRKNALRSLVVYRELVKVTRLLEAQQIPSIALKGAYLARFAYPDPALRPMRDLDLLLKPEQVVRAFELLKECGYRVFDAVPEAVFTDWKHLPPLIGPEGIGIELHNRLLDSEPCPEHSTSFNDELWTRSRLKTFGGIEVRFLCTEDLLLHLCIHATLHHHFNLGPLALVDVVELVETHSIDWSHFLSIVRQGGWERCALSLLYLARRNLGARIPDEVIDALGGQRGEAVWLKSAEYLMFLTLIEHRMVTDNGIKVLYSSRLSGKLHALLSAAFPPRLVIACEYPAQADSMKVFLYYPLRWQRLISKRLPQLLSDFLSEKKRPAQQLALHRIAFDDWLCEKSPR